jgi:hypothetical protein
VCWQQGAENVPNDTKLSVTLKDKKMIAAGRKAHKKGYERWMNPEIARSARAWTYGWNKAHGVCQGCALCGPGTARMPSKFLVFYEAWKVANRASCFPVEYDNLSDPV